MKDEELLHAAEGKSESEPVASGGHSCADSVTLQLEGEVLLAARKRPSQATADMPLSQGLGAVIADRYALQEKIGEGGMGEVWVARQTEPVKRKVALKLIKCGMDSRSVLKRFEQERQALALMDHPNIARVLDGGMTSAGQPFFVMELVNGQPLNKFCDEMKLTLKERLELFLPICKAVQHAHQKGIVHRDLKPANILVTMIDGKPVPKVIDFGVAKATSGKLTDETLATGFGAVVGTLEYMSPEQAGFSGEDVDTRADIYSLGVVLYELLTGLRPIDAKRLRQAALGELIRIILEEEPSKPSTRLSTDESLPSVAAVRQIEPKKLTALLQGELDWVVMKCLEKHRDRRYETANALARDVQRYLEDETVEARPPSAGYRLRKFIKRNKGQVIAASLVFLSLVAGIIGTAWQARIAERARKNEAALRVIAEENELEANLERARAEASAKAEREAQLEANAKRVEAEKNLEFSKKGNAILASVFTGLDPRKKYDKVTELRSAMRDNLSKAVAELEGSAIGDPIEVAKMQTLLGQSLNSLGENQLAVTALEKAWPILESRLGPSDAATLRAKGTLATAYAVLGQTDRALPLQEEKLRLLQTSLGPEHEDTLTCLAQLAFAYLSAEKPDKALPLLVEAMPKMKSQLGPRHEITLRGMSSLASSYSYAGDHEKALRLFEETLPLMKAELGPDDIDTVVAMHNCALAYQDAGMASKAQPLFEEVLPLLRKGLGHDHPNTLITSGYVAKNCLDKGKQEEGLRILEEIVPLMKIKLGIDNGLTLVRMNNLAATYWKLNRLEQSIPLFEELLALETKKLGRNHAQTLQTMVNLGVNLREAKRNTEALSLLEEVYQAPSKSPALQDFSSRQLLQTLILTYRPELRQRIDDMFAEIRSELPRNSPQLAALLSLYGASLLEAKEFAKAEPILREAFAVREKTQPDDWSTFNTESLLGGVLLGRENYEEAESLLLEGYEGLRVRKKAIPPLASHRTLEALDRLINLYTVTNKPEQLQKWQAERARYSSNSPSEIEK